MTSTPLTRASTRPLADGAAIDASMQPTVTMTAR